MVLYVFHDHCAFLKNGKIVANDCHFGNLTFVGNRFMEQGCIAQWVIYWLIATIVVQLQKFLQ